MMAYWQTHTRSTFQMYTLIGQEKAKKVSSLTFGATAVIFVCVQVWQCREVHRLFGESPPPQRKALSEEPEGDGAGHPAEDGPSDSGGPASFAAAAEEQPAFPARQGAEGCAFWNSNMGTRHDDMSHNLASEHQIEHC